MSQIRLVTIFWVLALAVSVLGQTRNRPVHSGFGLQADSPWPKLQGNIANTGVGIGGGSNGLEKWTVPFIAAYFSAPAIAADGTIYVASTDDRKTSNLLALNPLDGSLKWSFATGAANSIQASPTIGADGTIYTVGAGTGGTINSPTLLLYAINPDGTQKWVFGGFGDGGYYLPEGAPTIATDGTIYFAAQEGLNNSTQNYLVALNPNGSVKWAFAAGPDYYIQCQPAIGADGTIYFGTWDGIDNSTTGQIFAVNPDGTQKWNIFTQGQIVSSPAIGPNGTIYIGEQAGSNKLHALNPDGTEQWFFTTGSSYTCSPTIDSSGNIYAVSVDGVLHVIAPNGTVLWTRLGVMTSPAIGADGTIYVGSEDYQLYALAPGGAVKWSFLGLGFMYSSFAIGADGTVYYGEIYGNFYAIGNGLPPPNGYSVSPSSVTGGESSVGTVTLLYAAPLGGEVVNLKSSDPSTTVPTSIMIAAGATQGTVPITTTPVSTVTTVTLTATAGSASVTATLTVNPPLLNGLSLSPTNVGGGAMSTGSVTLNGTAPTGGILINLASNNANATVPVSVTVPKGASTANFTITTVPVSGTKTATITATQGAIVESAILTIGPLAAELFRLNPDAVIGGTSSSGTIVLNGPAPPGGVVVKLSSSLTSVATVPSTLTFKAGSSSEAFTITTKPVSTQKTVTIAVSFDGVTKSETLTVNPPVLVSVSVNPSTLLGGSNSTGEVTIQGQAPLGGLIVQLKSSSSAAIVPVSVTVPAGKTIATFVVKTLGVGFITSATITAGFNGGSETATLTINPPILASVAVSPKAVVGGQNSTGTVTLSGPAPVGGIVVSLTSNQGIATVPATVTVASGKSTAVFTIKTKTTKVQATAMISAFLGAVITTANLTIMK